jgi:catechol 2,3-dioxygenase-like lactoylglutathione lyase family enzyme
LGEYTILTYRIQDFFARAGKISDFPERRSAESVPEGESESLPMTESRTGGVAADVGCGRGVEGDPNRGVDGDMDLDGDVDANGGVDADPNEARTETWTLSWRESWMQLRARSLAGCRGLDGQGAARKIAAMIDHMSLPVKDVAKAKKFYAKALAPLGYAAIVSYPDAVGFGPVGKKQTVFWVMKGKPAKLHIAFVSKDRKRVDAFHVAALAAGAKDYGAPGLRPKYHKNYYGAFVIDSEGNNAEAVCHTASKR